MLTLHTLAEDIKTLVKWIVILLFITLFIVLGLRMKALLFPAELPPPEKKFGNLPPLEFPNRQAPVNFTYTLDTITGDLPTFPDRTHIYTIEQPKPNLLATNRASEQMKNIGFLSGPQAVSESNYQWINPKPPEKTIIYNVLTSNFKLTSNFYFDPVVLSARRLGNEADAIEVSQKFLNDLQAFPNDLDEQKTKTTLYAINENSLIPQTALSNTQIIRVDFFQKDVDGIPIVYPLFNLSTMNLFVGSGAHEAEVVGGSFFHQNIGADKSTYPLKSIESAFDELKNNKGYIAISASASKITVKKIYLGYFLRDIQQKFLYPVFVFEGDNFAAYVAALKSD